MKTQIFASSRGLLTHVMLLQPTQVAVDCIYGDITNLHVQVTPE